MKKTILSIYLSLLPFFDMLTALMTRHLNTTITLGIVLKTILIILMVIYIIKTKSKYKKISIATLGLTIIYIISYFIFKSDLIDPNFFLKELQFLFKLIYFPIVFFGLLCYCDDKKIEKKEIVNVLRINLIIYTILLIIPLLLNNAYTTYPVKLKGYIGWFYAGNEIANIMIILFPFAFYYLFKHSNKYAFLIILPITHIILTIGTKVATFGVIIIYIITLIFSLLKNKISKQNIILLLLTIFSGCLLINSYAIYNYKYMKNNQIKEQEEIIIDEENVLEVNEIKTEIQNILNQNNLGKFLKSLLSGRDMLLANTISVYNDTKDNSNIFFGIGFSNTEKVNNSNIARLIEIDIFDLYFHFGIIGLLISFMPFIYIFYLIIKNHIKITLNRAYFYLLILLFGAISSLSGHVLIAPAVSTYVIFYLLLLIANYNFFAKQELKERVTILALHLDYGGIEKAIVDQANMISSKYEVEIVCIYKMNKKIPYNINKNVKIKYLTNLKPNKEEIITAIKNKKTILLIKELFKSAKILYKKKNLMANYIYNCDSKIIISSRIFITKLLNKYGNKDAIKIAEEHVYHKNNKKYLKQYNKSTTNIDYILPCSKYITNDYKNIIKTNAVIKHIPLTIDYIPNKINNLKNKNIIAVGRLEQEKGPFDLIEVMKEINTKNKDIKLTIVGDGSLLNSLKQLVKEYKLDKHVNFTGFLNQKDLYKEYQKASLLINTSFEESYGLAVIEAMSYGIPAIGFSSALGLKEIIEDKYGIIVENRDIKKMANEIIKYFNNIPKDLNKKVREKALEYHISNVEKVWLQFLDEALKKQTEKKVIFISSAGGHFNELLQLDKTIEKYNSYIITEENESTKSYKSIYGTHIKYLKQTNRHEWTYIYKMPANIIKTFILFYKINPDVIISTGAHTAVAMCYIGKIFNKKIIFIETFANINTKSLSGKLVYPIANVFIVQWEDMLKLYPKAVFNGGIY